MIKLQNVSKSYTIGNAILHDVNVHIRKGEITGLIGKSGCGKSTMAKIIMRLEEPTSGTIYFDGKPLQKIAKKEYYQQCQIVFQNATAALNPAWTVRAILAEAIVAKKEQWGTAHVDMLQQVGLSAAVLDQYPGQLSGGEKQRVNLLRALFMKPSLLICDEIVSNLDRINQKELIELLIAIQKQTKMTILFISHDLHIVKYMCSSIYQFTNGQLLPVQEESL